MKNTENLAAVSESIVYYIISLPENALSGDLFSVVILLILLYAIALLIIRVSAVMIRSIKTIVILIIIAISLYLFINDFIFRLISEGLSADNIVFGMTGLIAGFISILLAWHTARVSVRKYREHKAEKIYKEEISRIQRKRMEYNKIETEPENIPENRHPQPEEVAQAADAMPEHATNIFTEFSRDNPIGTVILYLIVAEFGIFSSKTISAATPETGLVFFIIFMALAFVFIKYTYKCYMTGLKHLAAAFVIGFLLSVVLGHFWGAIPLKDLLSVNYFSSDALVALITGLSLSLFMSSKG
ncbi:hypothetical protein [Methanoplanus limicola]|uniref:Uncharacterized protein n=1 Tax=Methanoplanus limicola DSM 2279 TaxID=937775 RepID=H1Z3B2_9EURY|nr:hypothetical protein [Methanoplanus limicola]EHQ36527.1 hypothetical protein Metlim_2480 [Methanoplanus limicola DSM 2279]